MDELQLEQITTGNSPDMRAYFVGQIYFLMLVGAYESPLGACREATMGELSAIGEWKPCSELPTEAGTYLLEGAYLDDYGETFQSAILPAWFHLPETEWEVNSGFFSSNRNWMKIPFLPAVWDAAVALEETRRVRAQRSEVKDQNSN